MVGVGIIDLVCYAGQYSESLAVFGSKLARQSLGGSRQNGIVMLIFLAEIIDAAAHVSHDFKTEFLRILILAVMFAGESHKTFRQTDKADTESTLIDYRFYGVVRSEFFSAGP